MTTIGDQPQPPRAKRVPTVIASLYGQEVVNEYEWLRDPDDPDVRAYLEAENAYAEAVTAHAQGLQMGLRAAPTDSRMGTARSARPLRRTGGYRFTLVDGERDHPVVYRAPAREPEGWGQAVLDLNDVARGHAYLHVGAIIPSDDGEYLAYAVDLLGNERYTLAVTDLRTGGTVVSGLENAESVTWANAETLIYVEVAEAPWRGQKVWRLDVPTAQRELVYAEEDRSLYLAARRSSDGRCVFLDVLQRWSWAPMSAVEVRVIDATDTKTRPRVLVSRSEGVEVRADSIGDHFFLRVDDRGPYGRLVRVPRDGRFADREEVLPHEPGSALDDLLLTSSHAVLTQRHDGLAHIRVVDVNSGETWKLPLPEPACSVELDHSEPVIRDARFRYRYSSLVTPETIVEHDLTSGEAAVIWRAGSGGVDPVRYEVLRSEATARDGTRIPVYLLRGRDAGPGQRAVVLQGYGCYGVPQDPSFDRARFTLVDRGVMWAFAQVRGGGEFGRPWHDGGRRSTKRTTFDDFIAVAEHMIEAGYAASGRVVIRGRSAGGTLVAAAANLRPDLFRAVIAHVPFADPLHVQLDDSMPFTVYERAEWGDPYLSPDEFHQLASYCPFTNVEAKDYPAMYITASFHDGEVPYWQPAKYVAKLRHLRTDSNPLIFRTNFEAGHLGSSRPALARYDRAFEDAFILDSLGLG